ncbi:SusC/RagA family TonB-linked outer membrane protein [Flavobacterium pectinovorum]|uniref:Iron complex outermembrane recepter protein n=1 Tax=Flavobacterium pectinovorum TaxID=29533 RepID=A0AB36NZQ3_9FLAO|nr:SusC/RagA family TonB-linked outer membrane protein [Flavobacterium pectinovorum]OXB04312.1 SusC/RagA family TonB-linked outer membrane protein [Flavobacterium pectinovorum]SHL53670.1 iron complex outermembrane recepter protein [Flavobacterium pectinovorum]
MYFKRINLNLLKGIFFLILALLCVQSGYSTTVLKKSKIENKIEKATLVSIFSKLSKKTDYKFSYGQAIIADNTTYTVNYSNESVDVILSDLSRKANFNYNINGKLVLIQKTTVVVKTTSEAEKIKIKGKIIDENGVPMPGVTVLETATKNATVSNFDGEFELSVTEGKTIEVSYLGYKTKTVGVQKNFMTIQLEPNTSELSEVLIVGYGKQSKKDVTGAVTQLEAANFKQGVNVSVDNLIQGKVAGVRVVNTSGEPGAGVNVTIRGVGSIRSGSTPLFVVDGMPLSNDDVSPTGSNVGFGASSAKNPLNFLNTSDIESITVLKDASAAAIYGARGSNGVVLVTTKKGSKGEGTLTFDSYMGVSKVAHKLDVLSAEEYRGAIKDPAFDHGGNTDWQDVIYRSAVTTNNALSFAKQTESGNYYASVAQMDQEGIIRNSNFKRLSGRINAAESFLDNKRLKIKVNLTASETKDDGVPTSDDGGSNGQLIVHTLMANPTRSVFDANGKYTNFNMNAHYNPAYLLSIYEDQTRTLRVLGNFEASFRIIDGLEYKLNVGVDRSSAERNTTIYPNLTDLNPKGKYVQNNLDSKNSLVEHYLTYNLLLDKHKFEVLGGFSYQKFEKSGTSFSIDGISAQGVGIKPSINPGFAGTQSGTTGYAQENELQSYFGRLNYTFNDKYLLTASMRADGSTRFGDNNKYGYFPSFALGWNISKESFMENVTAVNNLKLRASWGETGNQEVQNKLTKASYSLSGPDGYYLYDDLNLVNGVSVTRTANPDLKWEVVTQANIGLDFSLWSDKLYGTVDYFNKTTTDAILNVPSSPLKPTTTVWTNIDGKIVNTGLEIMLGSKLVNTKNFTWNVDVNGATLRNKIEDLPVSEILTGTISGPGQSGVNANIYKSGYAAGSFYLLEHVGFDDKGANIFKDQNGDGKIDNSDRIIIEGALPTFYYGLNSDMTYKNFSFSFSIIGQTGGYLLNNTGLNALNINNLASDRNVATGYYESGANATNAPTLSTLFLEKSDFIRLNTARLGYNFDLKNVSWLNGLTLYVTGSNLITITNYTGYDPLINSPKSNGGNQSIGIDYAAYPTSRTFSFGATLKL